MMIVVLSWCAEHGSTVVQKLNTGIVSRTAVALITGSRPYQPRQEKDMYSDLCTVAQCHSCSVGLC